MKILHLVLLCIATRALSFGDQGQVFISIERQPFTFDEGFFEEEGGYRGFWHYSGEGLTQTRITHEGIPDRSLGSNGVLNSGHSIPWAILPEGKGVYRTLRSINGGTYLSRITANGQIDTNFGNRGFKLISATSHVRCAMVDASGRIVMVAERKVRNRRSFVMERYSIDGRLDRSFGQRLGYLYLSDIPQESPSRCTGIVMKQDQSIVASLYAFGPGNLTLIVNALPNGQGLNHRFANNGILDTSSILPDAIPDDLKLGINDTILSHVAISVPVNGGMYYDSYLMAIDAQGKHDRSFGSDGLIRFENSFVTKFMVDQDHKVFVAHEDSANQSLKVHKFLANGTPDPSFGTDGVSSPTRSVVNNWRPHGLILDRRGHIVVYGTIVTRGFVFTRLLPDGSLDRGELEDPATL